MRVFAAAVLVVGTLAPLSAAARPPAWTITLHGEENRPTALALVGGSAVWSVRRADGAVELRTVGSGGVRRLYRAPLPAAPPDDPDSFHYTTTVQQTIDDIGGSPTHLSFLRRVVLARVPKCLEASPPCRMPSFLESFAGEVLSGPLHGRFRAIARGDRREDSCAALPSILAAPGSALVYATEAPHRRGCVGASSIARVYHVALAPRRRVRALGRVQEYAPGVAVAGRYAAWSTSECACVTRYDVRTGRSVRVRAGDSPVDALRLQSDGKLVFIGTVTRKLGTTLCGREEIAYVPPQRRSPQFLGWPAHRLAGFGGNRVVYVAGQRADCTGARPRLVSQRLGHEPRTLPRPAQFLLDLNFDGSRLLTATAVGSDTVLRIEQVSATS